MHIMVNGEPHEHAGNGTVDALLDELGANKAHAALMINGNILPSDKWTAESLNEGDEIELLVFVGGG